MPADPDVTPDGRPETPSETEPDPPESLALAADFSTPSRDDWRALAAEVLAKTGGTDDPRQIEDALAYETYDGVRIAALYTADDVTDLAYTGLPGQAPFVRGATAGADGWDVRTRHARRGPEARQRGGSRRSRTRGDVDLAGARRRGLAVADLAAAMEGVYLDLAPVVLELTAGASPEEAEQALLSLGSSATLAGEQLRGSLGLDPIGARARAGTEADLAVLTSAWERHGDPPEPAARHRRRHGLPRRRRLPTRRRSASPPPSGSPTCGRSPRQGRAWTTRWRRWSSAGPSPPSSSRRSPSCAPPAASGTASPI